MIMNDARTRDWTEVRKERAQQQKLEAMEAQDTQAIVFRLLTDPVLNLMNPQDLRFDAKIGVVRPKNYLNR